MKKKKKKKSLLARVFFLAIADQNSWKIRGTSITGISIQR